MNTILSKTIDQYSQIRTLKYTDLSSVLLSLLVSMTMNECITQDPFKLRSGDTPRSRDQYAPEMPVCPHSPRQGSPQSRCGVSPGAPIIILQYLHPREHYSALKNEIRSLTGKGRNWRSK